MSHHKHKLADVLQNVPEGAKHTVDTLSVGTMLGSLVKILPEVAALFTIVWTAIRIWETKTVRGLRAKLCKKKEEKKDES